MQKQQKCIKAARVMYSLICKLFVVDCLRPILLFFFLLILKFGVINLVCDPIFLAENCAMEAKFGKMLLSEGRIETNESPFLVKSNSSSSIILRICPCFKDCHSKLCQTAMGFVLVLATRAGNIEAHKSQILTFLINFPQKKVATTAASAAAHNTTTTTSSMNS